MASVYDGYKIPRLATNLPPVVYVHGAGGDARELFGVGVPAVDTLTNALDKQWPVVCVTATQTWGNATCIARMDSAVAYARGVGAHPTAPPLLIGASHGAACVLTYAYNRRCLAIVGVIPAVDMQAIRVADTLGQRATIDAAWGVTYPAALPAGANPAVHTEPLRYIPQQLWYANNDAVSANIAAYATAVRAELHDVGALGHTDAAVAAVTRSDVVRFLEIHGT